MKERRWDIDERGRGVASAEALAPDAELLVEAMRGADWVAEQPEHHLLPHIRSACARDGSRVELAGAATDPQGVFVVDLAWRGGADPGYAELREEVFRVLGSFVEASTFVVERPGAAAFDVVTGLLDHQTGFAAHGHTVRFRVSA